MIEIKVEATGFRIESEPFEDVGFTLSVNEQWLNVAEEICGKIGAELATLCGYSDSGTVKIYVHDPSKVGPWRLVATTGEVN